ncbi:hypothetical protein EV421DRAFT_1907224 [Armillaria borealis]|uniref:Uncharacterized protein n=1 Tax=Armillaria borealis TaxID=47425 RepID=A0AA39J9W7_9AGAR|nr:hypothetical protein EV421DRAFT_1907224 [Armillaria borealis]
MSQHEYVQMYISTIHPMLWMMIDQHLAVLFLNQNPVEEVRKAAKYLLESYRSPYCEPSICFLAVCSSRAAQQALQHAPQYAQPPPQPMAPLLPYGQQQMIMLGRSISDMIDQLSKATAAGPPLAYYNPYGYPLYSSQPQAAAPQAIQQQMVVQPAETTVKAESSMEERLLAAIQRLADKSGANKCCGYNGCEIGYKDCIAKKSDMDKGLIKFDHIKQKLVMPDGSELPKGSGYLKPQVDKWHEDCRSSSATINMIATQHRYGVPTGVVYPQDFGPKLGNTTTFAMVMPSQLTSLYEKHAETQVAQLMACLEEQLDNEGDEEDQAIKVLEQILQEHVKAKKDGRPSGKRLAKPFKKVEVVILSTEANQPSATVPASNGPTVKESAAALDTSAATQTPPAKVGMQPIDAKKDHQQQYKHMAPIIKSGMTNDLYNCVLDSKVEVSIKEL